jgi:hypothetical protein
MNQALHGMRGAAGTLLLFIAGFFVSLEVFVGFALMHKGRGLLEQAWSLHRFVPCALVSLAAAAWVCPERRLLRVGRAMILGSAAGLVPSLPPYFAVPDPLMLTWKLGLINFVAVGGLGLVFFTQAGGILPGMKRASRR